MSGEERQNKKVGMRDLISFALAILVASLLFVTYELNLSYTETNKQLKRVTEDLEELRIRVEATSTYVTIGNITLEFEALRPVQYVSANTITFLLGFLTVKNLTNIVARPITLTVTFSPNVTYPDYGKLTYEYTDVQSLQIPPQLDEVLMPWGAFPINISEFQKGDVILWFMRITATCTWIGNPIVETYVDVTFKLIVK